MIMASNPDFVQYIVDQCAGAGEVAARKMFGDWCLYCGGKPFGLVCDNGLYVKPTDAGRRLLRAEDMRPPYEGLVKATCAALPEPKPRKKGR